jgi:hypothetical protein
MEHLFTRGMGPNVILLCAWSAGVILCYMMMVCPHMHKSKIVPLDVAKVVLVLQMLQWDISTAAAYYSCWAYLHARECGGAWAGNRVSADQDGVARDT